MRRKAILVLAVYFLIALAGPTAHAGSNEQRSRERNDQEISIQPDSVPLLELPAAEVFAAVDSGEIYAQVTSSQMMQAIEAVTGGEAVSITVIAPEEDSGAKIVIPKGAFAAVAEETDAELSVVSGLGQATFASAAVASIAKQSTGEDVTVSLPQEGLDADPQISILSGGKRITNWDGEAIVSPVGSSRPMAVSPLAVQVSDSNEGGAVRLYAAYACFAAAILIPGACAFAGAVRKCREKTGK